MKFYDLVASKYDEIVGEDAYAALLGPLLIPLAHRVHRVLDIGAGTGKTIEAVLAFVKPDAVVAVDVSARMLAELKKKRPCAETYRGEVGDYFATRPDPFDVITAFSVFELLSDVDAAVASLARNLKAGGLFACIYEPIIARRAAQAAAQSVDWAIAEAPRTIYRRHPSDMTALLRRNGLHIVEDRVLPNASYGAAGWVDQRFLAATAAGAGEP